MMAERKGAHASQIAIAWLLKRSPVILPIPGTSKFDHLEANVTAANVSLTGEEFAELDKAANWADF